jgi:hypothetical protein
MGGLLGFFFNSIVRLGWLMIRKRGGKKCGLPPFARKKAKEGAPSDSWLDEGPPSVVEG